MTDDTSYEKAAEQLDKLLQGLKLYDAVSLLLSTLANIYTSKQRSRETFLRDCGNHYDELAKDRVVAGRKH